MTMEEAANLMDVAAALLEEGAKLLHEEARWIRQDSTIGEDHRESYASSSLASRARDVNKTSSGAIKVLEQQ